MFAFLPNSVLQMCTIFLSIIIEALPFVFLGCILSGFLQIFLTPQRVKKILPKNKILSLIFGIFLGFFFPSCECGIVPVVNQLIRKDVPTATAIGFMLTAPIINPIVIFSTYIAFGNSFKYASLRVIGGFLVAFVVGLWLIYLHKGSILKTPKLAIDYDQIDDDEPSALLAQLHAKKDSKKAAKVALVEFKMPSSKLGKLELALQHSVLEVFDTGQYLIIGALIAAAMQTYLPTAVLLTIGSTKFLSILVMIVLAFTMSLCSEADAFIGASLLSIFGSAPVVAFLVFGPMVDIKNLLMMNRFFNRKFILSLVAIVTITVTIYTLFL